MSNDDLLKEAALYANDDGIMGMPSSPSAVFCDLICRLAAALSTQSEVRPVSRRAVQAWVIANPPANQTFAIVDTIIAALSHFTAPDRYRAGFEDARDMGGVIAANHKPPAVPSSIMRFASDETREAIHDEHRGEKIAAEMISRAIRAMEPKE